MIAHFTDSVKGQQVYQVSAELAMRLSSVRVSGRYCEWKLAEKKRGFLFWRHTDYYIIFPEPFDKSGRRIRIEVL